jgi:hypothetical protein
MCTLSFFCEILLHKYHIDGKHVRVYHSRICQQTSLNTSIVIYDFWHFSVLRSSTPSMPIFGNRLRQKACLLTNTRMIHTNMFTKSTFPWMQRHYVNYYKGEQLYETNRRETTLAHPRIG